jgi:hypothetical protein
MALGALTGLGLSYYLIFAGFARENKEQLKAAPGNTGPELEGDH